MSQKNDLRDKILELTREYYRENWPAKDFVPGKDSVPVNGKVFDGDDLAHLVDASLDFWLTTGRYAQEFEAAFAQEMGTQFALLTNSGSSANLLAVSCLTSPTLGERRLCRGDEVITVAAGFPTTINPIIQNGCVPVFLDVTIPNYNVDVSQLESALSPKTKAIIIAHTLGNPFDVVAVKDFAKRHNLWLIEDCCDAVGASFQGKKCATFGDIATTSFYPAHHITMGEGGAVLTSDPQLKKLIESFRDWGRDCWCGTGQDNTCAKRFDWKLGDLPYGYDHKFTYSEIGYNLKVTDMQAAVGVSQLKKLHGFGEARARNFQYLHDGLRSVEKYFILPEPTPGSEPSWFGFPLAVRTDAPFNRDKIIRRLDASKIGTRLLFGGNLTRQPAYKDVPYRVIGDLANTDFVMNQVFWIGVYQGLDRPKMDYVINTFRAFCSEHE
ncbi:MAG: lipopolysaccharide biosynthesis protein RfbH [Armatimonadetes bacterium]|nr:lipopolysaccharide biosynthesis protein RfbH [Armatimonadota bacterium]